MGGKKVNLQFISNNVKRKAIFRRRGKGILKKAHELSTLCDVDVCLIVYGPNEAVPLVWPSISEATRILRKLKEIPWVDQSRNMMNQEAFTKSMIGKLENRVRKMDMENAEIEMQIFMNDCLAGRRNLECMVMGMKELKCLESMVEKKLNEVKRKMVENNRNLVDGWLSEYIYDGTPANINSGNDNHGFNSMNVAYEDSGNIPCDVMNPTVGNFNPAAEAFSYFFMN